MNKADIFVLVVENFITISSKTPVMVTQSTGAVEFTNCISAEG